MNIYDVGDQVDLGVTFAANGVATPPTTVTCTVRHPDGTTTTPAVTGAAGVYACVVIVDATGTWSYRWLGVGGDAQGAEEGTFYVRQRAV